MPAIATDGAQEAEIKYRGIKIIVDGQQIYPHDANGHAIEPFIMDGTTYLPVHAIADALGLEVRWRESDSTVILKSPAETEEYEIDTMMSQRVQASEFNQYKEHRVERVTINYRGIQLIIDGVYVQPQNANGKPTEPFIIDGTTYLPVRAVADALGLSVYWDDVGSTVTLSRWFVSKYTDVFGYDKDGLFQAQSEEICSYSYNERGQLTLRNRSYGWQGTHIESDSYEYDGQGRLTAYVSVRDGNTCTGSFTYDDAGNMMEHSRKREPGEKTAIYGIYSVQLR